MVTSLIYETTYYLLKDLPGYLLWLAHTVPHWVIIQTTIPICYQHNRGLSDLGLAYPCIASKRDTLTRWWAKGGSQSKTSAQQRPSVSCLLITSCTLLTSAYIDPMLL